MRNIRSLALCSLVLFGLVSVHPVQASDSDSMSESERYESLAPLDEMITLQTRRDVDANRAVNRDKLERLVRSRRAGVVDLRYRDTPVKKQFGGTCSTFGLVGAMENLLGGGTELSERHLWSQYHHYSAEEAITTASTGWGVVTLDYWPSANRHPYYGYLDQPWYALSKSEYLDADITRLIDSLDHGNPAYVALSTPKDMIACAAHIDPNTVPYPGSGHALAVVGYQIDARLKGGGSFLVKNSWGPQCADHGYQWMPFSLCQKEGMYCVFWSVQGVTHD